MEITRTRKIQVIWNEMHHDHKGSELHNVMLPASLGGGLGNLNNLDDDAIEGMYQDAFSKQERKKTKKSVEAIFLKNGMPEVDKGLLNQWCGTWDGARDLVNSFGWEFPGQKAAILRDFDKYEELSKETPQELAGDVSNSL